MPVVIAVPEAPARAAPARPGDRPRLLVVAYVIAVGAAGFLAFWSRSDLWLDEALTVNIARLPLGELRAALERDGAPPLYYVLLHAWTGVLGDGDVAARSLSGVFAVAAAVVIWFAARRVGGSRLAWIASLLFVANPFVIRYATEARMYMLAILLVALGTLAVQRAVERPDAGRLTAVAAVSAALVYTQYWAFSLLAVVAGAAVLVAIRRRDARATAGRLVAAMAAGAATFVLWLPTFLFQRAHTGTPWGDPVLPGTPIGETLLAFSGGEEQEGWLLLLVVVPLLALGVFGLARSRFGIDLDLRGRPEALPYALVGAASLVLGTTLAYLAGQAFEPRYSAIVFPFFALLTARGATTIGDAPTRIGVITLVVLLGLVGGVRNATEQRTQAGAVAAVLRDEVKPDDLVVYCPDQLGPAVHRLLPADLGAEQVTYPDLGSPAFVDWVDYQERLDGADARAFAAEVLARAGGATLWYVTGPGYPKHAGACEALGAELAAARPPLARVLPDEDYFEKPGLVQHPVPGP